MSRLFRALVLTLLVAGCGSADYQAPRGLDDACSIVAERPHYLRAFRDTERRWGVPVNVQMAIIYQESKFIANARPPHQYALGVIPVGRQSSAYGYSQALDGTWEEYVDEVGGWGKSRDDIDDARARAGSVLRHRGSLSGIAGAGVWLGDDATGDNVVAEYFRDGEEPVFGVMYDGGFAMGQDLPLFREVGQGQAQQVTTSTGEKTTVGPNANFGTISSGGLY